MHYELLQQLYATGMYYGGVKKEFCGKVKQNEFFEIPALVINRFGYYENDDGSWVAFVTDDERGMEIVSRHCRTEQDAAQAVLDLAESNNIAHLSRVVVDSLSERKPVMHAYLMQEYRLPEQKAREITEYIYRDSDIAFEFFYYIENKRLLPDKYACCYSGYTAKRLITETHLIPPDAFQYMVFLKQYPAEALAELQKRFTKQ